MQNYYSVKFIVMGVHPQDKNLGICNKKLVGPSVLCESEKVDAALVMI